MKRFVMIFMLMMILTSFGCEEQDKSNAVIGTNNQVLVDLDHIRNCMGKDVMIEFKSAGKIKFRYGLLYQVDIEPIGKLDCYLSTPAGNNANIYLWDTNSIKLVSAPNPPLQIEVMKLPEKGGEK
ncbi:MAG: hypothetical protein WC650_05775 [Candidatus Doudnabacteria bacterium]